MDLSLPLNAAVGGAVVLIAVAVGILVKATTVLEKAVEALRDFEDGISDLRVATGALRTEVIDLRSTHWTQPPRASVVQAAGPWPFLHDRGDD